MRKNTYRKKSPRNICTKSKSGYSLFIYIPKSQLTSTLSICYKILTSNINKYGDKLINVSGDVIDIFESDDGTVTYLHLSDYEGNNYVVHYLGSLDNVFEGGYTWGYALPLDIITFENQGGSYTEAVVCAGCYIENPEE